MAYLHKPSVITKESKKASWRWVYASIVRILDDADCFFLVKTILHSLLFVSLTSPTPMSLPSFSGKLFEVLTKSGSRYIGSIGEVNTHDAPEKRSFTMIHVLDLGSEGRRQKLGLEERGSRQEILSTLVVPAVDVADVRQLGDDETLRYSVGRFFPRLRGRHRKREKEREKGLLLLLLLFL